MPTSPALSKNPVLLAKKENKFQVLTEILRDCGNLESQRAIFAMTLMVDKKEGL